MSKQVLLTPAAGLDWEVWAVNGQGSKKSNGDLRFERTVTDAEMSTNSPSQAIVALPVSQCLMLPIWLTSSDPGLYREMILAQLEKRGLPIRSGLVFDYSVVAEVENRSLVRVTMLPADFPDALCIARAKTYISSACVLPFPENQIVLWRERNQLVLAVTRGCDAIYIQVISRRSEGSTPLPSGIQQDLHSIRLALEMDQVVPEIAGITLWGGFPEFESALKPLKLPLQQGTRPSPDAGCLALAASKSELLPLPLQTARSTRSRRDRNIRIAIVAAVAYVLLVCMLWIYLHSVQVKAARVMELVTRDKPSADKLEQTAACWRVIEPAVNPKLYAIEQFYQCASDLPGAGVRFETFETLGTTIRIKGTARNAPTVFRFVERLEKNKGLSNYRWKLGQPKLKNDDTADFKIEGMLSYGPVK